MTKCYIDFEKEIIEGLRGTKAEVKAYLKKQGEFDYYGVQRVRNREKHTWERVVCYSTYDREPVFVCYNAE